MISGMNMGRGGATVDVIGIGSALLDLIFDIDESMLGRMGLVKGSMQLIDEKRSNEIMTVLRGIRVSVAPGGSAANTIAGLSRFGGRGHFMGKVGKDENGDIYVSETEKLGIVSGIARDDSLTGHAITLITPDSERTFATHLGAAQKFTAADVDRAGIRGSRILHLEGYLFEPPALREACFAALECARENGVMVSVDLSDPELIRRIHDVFRGVLRDYVNIVFVNEDEARAFTGRDEEGALEDLAGLCDVAVVKLGSRGSIIGSGRTVHRIEAFKTDVVNTNGAGDMYASGVLYGISRNAGLAACGRYGSYGSSLVVARVGARYPDPIPEERLKELS